mgnify:CR=1 FL=1
MPIWLTSFRLRAASVSVFADGRKMYGPMVNTASSVFSKMRRWARRRATSSAMRKGLAT